MRTFCTSSRRASRPAAPARLASGARAAGGRWAPTRGRPRPARRAKSHKTIPEPRRPGRQRQRRAGPRTRDELPGLPAPDPGPSLGDRGDGRDAALSSAGHRNGLPHRAPGRKEAAPLAPRHPAQQRQACPTEEITAQVGGSAGQPTGMTDAEPSAVATVTSRACAHGPTPWGHFPMMTMQLLSRTVPSAPITRRKRSKATVWTPVRSNSTAPAPPAEVCSVATVPKLAQCHVSCHEAQSGNKKNGREEQKVHHYNSPRPFSQEILLFLTRHTHLTRGKSLHVPGLCCISRRNGISCLLLCAS